MESGHLSTGGQSDFVFPVDMGLTLFHPIDLKRLTLERGLTFTLTLFLLTSTLNLSFMVFSDFSIKLVFCLKF